MQKLTPRQRIFVESYVLHFNGARAARDAGYADARRRAYDLLQKDYIKEEIKKHTSVYTEQRATMRERIIEELTAIAFSNISDVGRIGPSGLDIKEDEDMAKPVKASIADYSVSQNATSMNQRVKFHNKTQALELLGKHFGLFEKEEKHTIQIQPFVIERQNGDKVELGAKVDE